MQQKTIEELAAEKYEREHPNGPRWVQASKHVKDSYRDEVSRPPR